MQKKRLAIFASGTGSNALNLIDYFDGHPSIEIGFVLSNKSDAPVLAAAQQKNIQTFHFSNQQVSDGEWLTQFCNEQGVDWVILAGYLRKIPVELIDAFEERIINLHPSLLPNYGGKGMYGSNVHKAVIADKATRSGITIHFVNSEFDKGRIIAQFHCALDNTDTVETLNAKIRHLEQSFLPVVIEKTIC